MKKIITVLLSIMFLISCTESHFKHNPNSKNSVTEIQKIINRVPRENIWYLKAGGKGDGKSAENPIGSTKILANKSQIGDTIVLISSEDIFDGGIKLKEGQRLFGLSKSGNKPIITNSNITQNLGCGILLSNNNHVKNIKIEKTVASGIFGLNSTKIRIDNVEVNNANQSHLTIDIKQAEYSTIPSPLPHGGMVFINSKDNSQIEINGSDVFDASGIGVVSLASNNAQVSLNLNHVKVKGGSKIGFFDVGIAAMVQDESAKLNLNVSDSEVQGRLSRSGRNVMIVASSGANANAQIKGFLSGSTGQDGIVAAVMQSPSVIDVTIKDSLIEGAGQMNIEGTLVNLDPIDSQDPDIGRVSFNIENSIVRNAGAVSGFEEVAANIWLGASQFISDKPPTKGQYSLVLNNSRIEGAGRSGLEFGDLDFFNKGFTDESDYKAVLRNNAILNNGTELMINAPNVNIDASNNCWNHADGLIENEIKTHYPDKRTQVNTSEPILCDDVSVKDYKYD